MQAQLVAEPHPRVPWRVLPHLRPSSAHPPQPHECVLSHAESSNTLAVDRMSGLEKSIPNCRMMIAVSWRTLWQVSSKRLVPWQVSFRITIFVAQILHGSFHKVGTMLFAVAPHRIAQPWSNTIRLKPCASNRFPSNRFHPDAL